MRYSQYIGIGLILVFGALAYLPWIYVPSAQLTITGIDGGRFGVPALFNFFCCALSLAFFAIPRLWAKRANVFVTSMNLAWALRNLIIFHICSQGDCPEVRPGLYLMFLSALGILVMSFLPTIKLPTPDREKKEAP